MILGTLRQELNRLKCNLGIDSRDDYCAHFNDPVTCLHHECREKREKDKPKSKRSAKR